ncbi:MAG TPA: hypothetical protein VGB37_14810 [Candidatus Lokiarchaeia archaeon]
MKTKKQLIEEKDNISLCSKCNCMTKSIKIGSKYKCGKCGELKNESY